MSATSQAPAPPRGAPGGVYAALDLGTNNCRLLIAEAKHGTGGSGFVVIDSFSRIVRLGQEVSATGKLAPEAMERTLSALRACKKKLDKYTITRARFVATEACRRAANAPEFLQRAERDTGMPIEIISGEEEAHLAFLGCASLVMEASERAIVFDIGGGSTELMWADVDGPHRLNAWLSVGAGVMNLADRFGGQDFADLTFADMVRFVETRIQPFDDAHDIRDMLGGARVQMLSTSGTVTTLAAIHLGLPRYDRTKIDGITLPVAALRQVTRTLLAMRPSERFHHPCIGPDRAEYILSGCAIFEAISNVWPVESITIADRGVREGIIMSLMHSAHGEAHGDKA